MFHSSSFSRRDFLKFGTAAFAGTALASHGAAAAAEKEKLFSAAGISGPFSKAAQLKAAGAEFLTESVDSFLVPDRAEAEFEKILGDFASSPLPVLACNGFIRPAHLRCVGADANHDLVLEWSEIAFRRLKKAGGKFIVFGSGSSRDLRDGWPKEKADAQFVALLKRMGPLAEAHGVTVTIEQLEASECNYINRISEGATLIRAAGHPNIRLLADLYHMAKMDDSPADLKAAMDVVVHVEIAEKENRSVPGVSGDDFRAYFRTLRETNYQGAISMEGNWQENQLRPAFEEIAKQAAEA